MTMFETLGRVMPAETTLKIECGCSRRTTWTRDAAIQRFGQGATPYDIRKRLRCTGCGRSGRATVWI